MDRTAAELAAAEVRLLVLDASARLDAADESVLTFAQGKPEIIVLNKIDLPRRIDGDHVASLSRGRVLVEVSAKGRTGLGHLRQAVVDAVEAEGALDLSGAVVTSLRHLDALSKMLISLTKARQSLEHGYPPDVVAVDVQDAIEYVGTVTGVVTNEEILDRVFSEFCIGK
jgi:tRNA modification GTPase